MLKLVSILAAMAVGALGQAINATAIEFHPDGRVGACGFIIEPDAIALLFSPQQFNTSLCAGRAEIAWESGTLVQSIPISGICHICNGENVALSTQAYVEFGAPQNTTIDVLYAF
ncbi:hypothetical protein B0H16DRAFT_1512561 [Mycena metata]|uniref:Uncharacterized protein n=1 Tax=Mycena metata TaxID=1033252 RepID=A0AAD7JUQ1_9AGAR|nr:hypothetical protein B0H16DRAFT_1512561 [Mycena metata]